MQGSKLVIFRDRDFETHNKLMQTEVVEGLRDWGTGGHKIEY